MIRILLVDDQKLIRQGLKALLELDSDIQVVGSASDGHSAVEQVEAYLPDVVLIDIRMPGMDGVTATQIICERFPDTKVLVLSGYDDEKYLADALRSGAKGYLLKDTPAEELIGAIRSIYKGYSQIGPGLLEKINSKIQSASGLPELTVPALRLEIGSQIKNFEPNTLKELVRLAIEQNAVIESLAYINSLLKENEHNLAALYLAGALSGINDTPENQQCALDYLKRGFCEGMKQELSPQGLLLFYQEGAKHNVVEAFSWVTLVDAPWNNELGLSFLLQEAYSLFGSTSMQYRSLLILRQIRAMRDIGNSYTALGEKIEWLQQSLENANLLNV